MSFTDVQATLMSAWQGTLSHPVAYEGIDFTPPDNAPWVALHTLPVTSLPDGLGIHAPIEHTGML